MSVARRAAYLVLLILPVVSALARDETASPARAEPTLHAFGEPSSPALGETAFLERAETASPKRSDTRAPSPFFTPAELQGILRNAWFIARLYRARRNDFQKAMGPGFDGIDEQSLKVAFAGMLAYGLKPYRQSNAVSLTQLLRDRGLDCDNYVMLTARLFQILQPRSSISLVFVGWDGLPTLNHAQLFVNGGTFDLLIDPTVGIVARTGFDNVARGIAVPGDRIADFFFRQDMASFHQRIVTALLSGTIRPHNLLYYYTSFPAFVAGGTHEAYWPTPQHRAIR